MTISGPRRYGWGALAFLLILSIPAARRVVATIDLDITFEKIDAGQRIARGSEQERAAFHRPYQFTAGDPSIEKIEVISEYRRLVLMTEERIARGDHSFALSRRAVEEALQPYYRRVSVVARARFPVQNVYVTAPAVDIVLTGPSGDVLRLDLRNTTQYFAMVAPSLSVPIMGVDGEAVFDATLIGQSIRTAIVRVGDKEAVRVPIDFSRLD